MPRPRKGCIQKKVLKSGEERYHVSIWFEYKIFYKVFQTPEDAEKWRVEMLETIQDTIDARNYM